MGTHIQETALGARRRPAPDFCQDSHACDLGERLNTGRRTLPRIRRALSAPEHARARPCAPRAALSRARVPCSRRAYKASLGVDRTPPRTLDLTGARDHRCLPYRHRARGHPIPRHRRPACTALPNHARPSKETMHASVKLPEQGIRLCLAGEASPGSPDFTRPPVNIDRASLYPIFRFLAHIASTSFRGAHRAVQLN
jgi:hypothetical protein